MIDTRTLGDYTLIKQVGQGSMGSVFLAEHRFMKKQYILKVLPEELASDRAFVQRFEEDVALLTSLEHPNIVKIHTVSFAQGQYFLVTDCVVDEFGETTNLAQYMLSRRKRFDEETLYRLLKQVADALDYAHGKKNSNKGIIHRNLKLNNILVAKGRGGIDLMISDFGLSRIIGTAAVLTRNFKITAEFLGISNVLFGSKKESDRYPHPSLDPQKLVPLHTSFLQNYVFLAPEQKYLESSAEAKVDAYAFGILAYYLLVGEFPEGYFEMPSKMILDMSWNWDQLICQCLSQNPEKRPESLVNALEAIRHSTKTYETKESFIGKQKESTPSLSENSGSAYQGIPASVPLPDILNLLDKALGDSYALSEASEEAKVGEKTIEHVGVAIHAETSDKAFTQQTEASSHPQVLRPIIRTAEIERPITDHDPAASLLVDATVKHYIPERKEIKNMQPILTDMVVIPGEILSWQQRWQSR